jgi:Gluconate 2-dehydrogenase subunit 3
MSHTSFPPEFISRREVSRRLLGLTAAWSLGGSRLAWGALRASAASDLANANWKPLFLTGDYAAVQSLAEAIIPGSTNALVARFIDLLLSVDDPAPRKSFLDALSAIQTEANRRFDASFQKLSAAQRDSLLTTVSSMPEGSPLRSAFDQLREWIAGAYYSSEIGMKELGWTPNRFFMSFPGCTIPKAKLSS